MTRQLDRLLAAVCVSACLAGCAQLPWLQGEDADCQNCQTIPRAQRLPKEFPFTTATEAAPIFNNEEPKKSANPYMLIGPGSTGPAVKPEAPPTIILPQPKALPQPPGSPAPLPVGPAIPPAAPLPVVPPGPPSSFSPYPLPPQIVQAGVRGTESQFRAPGHEPALDALAAFLQDRKQEFLAHLDKYDSATSKVFELLLPFIARLTQKNFKDLTPAEANGSLETLHNVIQLLLPKTDLVIDNVCFCEWVKAFGNYQPVADAHIFQASTTTRPGERIQLYVELRNFDSIKTDGFYETRLASVVEIRDKDNKPVWSHNFDDKGHAIRSRSLLHDYFNNYSFYLPNLPHGNYTLTIRIIDQTRAEARREKSKSVPFRVGSSQRPN